MRKQFLRSIKQHYCVTATEMAHPFFLLLEKPRKFFVKYKHFNYF